MPASNSAKRLCSPISQWLSALGMRLFTPFMCTALISNSCLAATNSSSQRQPCRNELCVLPVFKTVTEVSLSQSFPQLSSHFDSHHQGQQLQPINTQLLAHHTLRELSMEVLLLRGIPGPTALQTGIRRHHLIRLRPLLPWHYRHPIILWHEQSPWPHASCH